MTLPAQPRITVIGLGPGDPDMLTVGASTALSAAERVWVRTLRHPTVQALGLGSRLRSFDHLYNSLSTSDEVYQRIAADLVDAALQEPCRRLVYAVPGSPSTGERSVAILRELAAASQVRLDILPAISAIESALLELETDPLESGLQAVDASELSQLLHASPSVVSQFLNPTRPLLISGVWQQSIASMVKLFLMSSYPPDWTVRLVRAGLGEAPVELPLEDLDRNTRVDHLTSLYVPPLPLDAPGASFYQLTHIMARLRGPGGCPWDREQTHASIKRHLLEEAYEAMEALDHGDAGALEEELGDVLLQVSLHSEIAHSDSDFDIGDVIRALATKLIRRHPHVFGEVSAETAAEVLANWHEIKRDERADRGEQDSSVLDGVPTALPALARAQSVSQRAAKSGFEWRDSGEVWRKVNEELAETAEAAAGTRAGDQGRLLEELGDLLFVLVNWARFNKLEAEEALRLATLKFERRFRELERRVQSHDLAIKDLSAGELEAIWNEVKAAQRTAGAEVAIDPVS